MIVMAVYRSPDSDLAIFQETFGRAIETILQKFNKKIKIVVAGDFNVDLQRPSVQRTALQNCMTSYGLGGTVWDYTRIQGNSRTTLDNVYTNIRQYTIRILPGLSDHRDIFFTASIEKSTEVTHTKKRLFTNKNYQEFANLLRHETWECVYYEQEAESKYNTFLNKYLQLFEQAFPLKNVSSKKSPPPSQELIQIRETLHLIEETYNQRGGDDLKKILSSYKKFYLDSAREERRNRNHSRVMQADNRPKTLWQIINKETGRHKIKTSETPSSEDLNNFFCNIATKTLADIPSSSLPYNTFLSTVQATPTSFFLAPVTYQEIEDTITKLKPKLSTDINGLNMKLIKNTKMHISTPLQDIINACFQQGTVPGSMKVAKVTAIFKKGEANKPENYRPIAVLPVFSKILESVLATRLTKFLEDRNILSQQQFGFREGRNTIDAVLSVLDLVWGAMEGGEDSMALLCDLSRAFDCMQRRILLAKLDHYGIRGVPLRLIQSYMEGRQQFVSMDGVVSEIGEVDHGVAQGSLVGPLFFTIFMNDLPSNVPGHTVLYADDTTLVATGRSHPELAANLEAAAKTADEWFKANQLSLNKEKTVQILFTCDRRRGEESTSAKLLGIQLDTRLTWRPHIDMLEKELAKAVYAVGRIKDIVGRDAAITAYHALFHAKMSYGIELWGESAHVEKILILQKRAVRTILSVPARCHCRPLFVQLSILTAPATYILNQLIRAKQELPKLQTRGQVTGISTRARNNVEVPRHRTSTTRAQHRFLQIFNMLPDAVRQLPPPNFKREVKRILLQTPIYSTAEWMNL